MSKHRKTIVKSYFEALDNARSSSSLYFHLFTDDVQLFSPDFGIAQGKTELALFSERIGKYFKSIWHDKENFNYISKDNTVVVEACAGSVATSDKKLPDNTIFQGFFCAVFEFENKLIKRVHIYNTADSRTSNEQVTRSVVNRFFELLGQRRYEAVVDLFADDFDWYIAGNVERFSWLGKRVDKNELTDFFREYANEVERRAFEIDFVAVIGCNAVVVGKVSAIILKYDDVYRTEFASIFKVENGKIIKYHFLEDSYLLNEFLTD